MSMRGELSIQSALESLKHMHESGSNLFIVSLALVLILCAVVSATFAPAPSDPIPTDAEWLIGP